MYILIFLNTIRFCITHPLLLRSCYETSVALYLTLCLD